jgi:hypothetical protein
MEENQTELEKELLCRRKQDLKFAVRTERINAGKSLAETIGVPTLVLGVINGVSTLISYPIENHDLNYMVSIGLNVFGGAIFGSPVIEYTLEKFGEFRDSLDNLRIYRGRLKTLE